MPIDITEPMSDGWWLDYLQRKLATRQPRLAALNARFQGDAPLPEATDKSRVAYREFKRKARTNYAELIVEALRERMTPVGFRTAADASDNGDAEARRVWTANGLDVEWSEVATHMLSMGDGYMMVGDVDDEIEAPTITAEDPRQVVTEHDPVRQRKVRAALKMFHDNITNEDLAYLFLRDPFRLRVAVRSVKRSASGAVRFSPKSWDWDEDRSGELRGMPVVRFRNRNGVGEFERHIDVLDRLDHQVYQRMVIATMQAFRQRAVKGLPFFDENGKPLLNPKTGQPIDLAYYEDLFVADPGAFWALPETAEMWESGQVDLTPMSTLDKDDIAKMAAVTRTPLPTLMPGDGAESAEGASFKREGLVFKAEDRIARASEGLKDVMATAFLFAGDDARSDRGGIEVLWMSPERRSLAERASASAQASTALPRRTLLSEVWQFTPDQIDRIEVEWASEALLAADPMEDRTSDVGEPAAIKAKADAMGVLIRAGVAPEDAAREAGLNVKFTGATPTSLRLPENEAEAFEALS